MDIPGKARLRIKKNLPEIVVFVEGVERDRRGKITSLLIHSPGNKTPARIDGLALRELSLSSIETRN